MQWKYFHAVHLFSKRFEKPPYKSVRTFVVHLFVPIWEVFPSFRVSIADAHCNVLQSTLLPPLYESLIWHIVMLDQILFQIQRELRFVLYPGPCCHCSLRDQKKRKKNCFTTLAAGDFCAQLPKIPWRWFCFLKLNCYLYMNNHLIQLKWRKVEKVCFSQTEITQKNIQLTALLKLHPNRQTQFHCTHTRKQMWKAQ